MFYRREISLFRTIAAHGRGEVKTKLFSSPVLRIVSGDKTLEIVFKKKAGRTHTVMSCAFPELREYAINLISQDYGLIKIEVGYGVQDILFNDKNFDRRYIVQGNQEGFVRNLLVPDIRQQLVDINNLHPRIILKDGEFTVAVPQVLHDEPRLARFLATGLSMVTRLKELK